MDSRKLIRLIAVAALTAAAEPGAAQLPEAAGGAGRLFDGAADASAPRPPDPGVPPIAALAVTEAPAPKRRSAADLYYFTPEEADRAARRSWPKAAAGKGYAFDADVPLAIQDQMRGDLAFLQGLQGSGATPLHRKIFGAVDGAAYDAFFVSRVTGIGMDDCGSGNAVACVIPFLDPSKMWLTQNYIRFSHPQVARMMVVYHEARHTEVKNRNWPHARCPRPFRNAEGRDVTSIWTGSLLAGEPACDVVPFGSYGSSTIMLKNIQKFCSNCTDKVRMDAGLYADDQLGRITEPEAKRQMLDDFGQ
ncbi:MAG: hypothetical protein HY554_16870 [Elusimicrobia bacterium]|nr:hypothetical protein [Elusimicrobiota bacterium]